MFQAVFVATILLSLLTGSISITLLSFYHQTEAVLIIIACSSLLYAIVVLITNLITKASTLQKFRYCLQILYLICQLIILGSSIEFFNYTIKNDSFNSNNDLHNQLLIVFESSLLTNLFFNGTFLGVIVTGFSPVKNTESTNTNGNICYRNDLENFDMSQNDLHDPKLINTLEDGNMINADLDPVPFDKFIPYKDSAQTLTPDLHGSFFNVLNVHNIDFKSEKDNIRKVLNDTNKDVRANVENKMKSRDNLKWMMQRIQSANYSEDQNSNSNASVIKHRLDNTTFQQSGVVNDNKSIKSRLRSLSNPKTPKKSYSLNLTNIKAKFNSNKKVGKSVLPKNRSNSNLVNDDRLNKNSISLNAKYLTRLSTISDLPRSFNNILNNSQSKNTNQNLSPKIDVRQSVLMGTNNKVSNKLNTFNSCDDLGKSPQMVEEREAIERFNDALLPSCLHIHKKTYNSENSNNRNTENDKNYTNGENGCVNVDLNNNYGTNNGAKPQDERNFTPNSIIRPQSRLLPDVDTENLFNVNNDHLVIEGLSDFSQVPNMKLDSTISNFYLNNGSLSHHFASSGRKDNSELVDNAGNLNTITLDMWENDKINLLRRISESQTSMLLSPFQFQNDLKMDSISESPVLESKPILNQDDSVVNDNILLHTAEKLNSNQNLDGQDNSDDTIGQLDEYFNEFSKDKSMDPVVLLENSLKQPDFSLDRAFIDGVNKTIPISKEYSKNTSGNNHKHSPTKSIVSLLSRSGSLHGQKSQTFNISTPIHTRTNSQIQNIFPQGSNNHNHQFITSKNYNYYNPNDFNNSNNNTSTQSSPTRQRFKRIGQKLSLTNISYRYDLENNDDNAIFGHHRGKTIDFSYLHQIQNQSSFQQSPRKSISGISIISGSAANTSANFNHDSPVQEKPNTSFGKKLRQASQMLYKHKNVTITDTVELPKEQTMVLEADMLTLPTDPRYVSNTDSNTSDNNYPTNVVSEYDKEKWNTLKSLKIVKD